MLQVEILHQAEVELWDTAKYYESKSLGLGVDFLNEMEEAILFIQEAPLRQPESSDSYSSRVDQAIPLSGYLHNP
jgi:hypothetical protein